MDRSQQPRPSSNNVTPSAADASRQPSDGILSPLYSQAHQLTPPSPDSWIEIASQPSSSSLSSAATDEIVTTGLRVRQNSGARHRRRLQPRVQSQQSLFAASSSASSSQEEYDESESDDDRIMTSSNEQVLPTLSQPGISPPLPRPYESAEEEEDEDEDENSTALGVPDDDQVFTPQPNAFSHPPSSQSREPVANSYFPRPNARPSGQRHSYPSRRTRQHTPYNLISPSYQADHDAALRASLSTLLSCAAAARGLSKHNQAAGAGARAGPSRVQPSTLAIVPESVVDASISETRGGVTATRRTSVTSSGSNGMTEDKGKRKAVASPSKSSKDRATKKTKRGSLDETVSPTLLTWVVSAGVVVIVSAISFSAGYAIGKEVGMAEAGVANAGDAGGGSSCGKEAVRGLRRFRWGTGGSSSISV